MVCVVKDCRTGQLVPACCTVAAEGMTLDTECEEVQAMRRLSLELLLSDHRADCVAPCTLVCPHGLDVARVIELIDKGCMEGAEALVAEAFPAPELKCEGCKAPCEKACRRGAVDAPVDIRGLIAGVGGGLQIYTPDGGLKTRTPNGGLETRTPDGGLKIPIHRDKLHTPCYNSRIGRFTEAEKSRLKATGTSSSRCLRCACEAQSDCKLRRYATDYNVPRPRFGNTSAQLALSRQTLGERLVFEPAKCIKCGLCVYNSNDGFTFRNRGFRMEVFLPDESVANVSPDIAALCPTGALRVRHVGGGG
jgi:ferredoxin